MSASTPIQTSLNNLSAWASFDSLLQRLDITTEPDFWDGLVMLIPYQDYFLESQYNDLAGGCVPGEAQQGPNKIQTPTPPNQPDPECLCANSPFYTWEIHGIECTEYRLLYWYHPDYLGHNEFITDNSGLPYQYFHYSAFGEALVEDNAHYGQFSSPYRFNAKELDQETGNYYYGARYYNPQISVWLSVDRLAVKYPHSSPYNFSLNNPINLIDPNGDSVKVSGARSKMLVKELNKRLRNELKIKRDKKSGKLTYELVGDKENISEDAQDMMNAIDDDRINVNVEASQSGINAEGKVAMGSFLGTELSSDGKSVKTYQKVVPFILKALDKASGAPRGQSILHEVLESYEAGILSLSQQINATPKGSIYESAHSCVLPQGFDPNLIGAERDPETGWVHFYINGSTYVETLRE